MTMKNRNWGGWRPGGGRPKGTYSKKRLNEMEARQHVVSRILRIVDPLVDVAIEHALGEFYIEESIGVGSNGEKIRKVYKQAPNYDAAKDLLELVIGKPKQPIEGSLSGVEQLAALATDIKAILNKPTIQNNLLVVNHNEEKPKEVKKEEGPTLPEPSKVEVKEGEVLEVLKQ